MRRPKGISSESGTSSGGSGKEEVSTSRSHSSATRVHPASCIFERYMEVGRMVTFSRMRSRFFMTASLAKSEELWLGPNPKDSAIESPNLPFAQLNEKYRVTFVPGEGEGFASF